MKIIFLSSKRAKHVAEIINYLRRNDHIVRDVRDEKVTAEDLLEYDLGISWSYRHIFKRDQIAALKHGILNMHIGYLPYGRGAMPNVWAIINDEPAGVTLHWIDEKIDTGRIIAQEKCPIDFADTGESLHARLSYMSVQLFYRHWYDIERNLQNDVHKNKWSRAQIASQQIQTHKSMDVGMIDDLEARFGPVARDIYNVLRARTHSQWSGAYIKTPDGAKIFIRLELSYEQTIPPQPFRGEARKGNYAG